MRVTTYVYPDGTRAIRKPRDGEVFRVWDPVDNNEVVWQWDGYKEQWCRKIEFTTFEDKAIVLHKDLIKCECGSEKSGSNRHSSWCKKWNPNQ